ncbi:MAG: type I pullulanase [Fimbriimonadaceae bacterium]
MRAIILSLLVFLAAILQAQLTPAFLDSRTEIRVALPTPRESIEVKDFILWIGKNKLTPSDLKVSEYAKRPTTPPSPDKVTLPGSFAPALGGNAWDPNDDTTRMTQTSPEIYSLDLVIPGGTYEFKLARGGTWAENYGANFKQDGQNISLKVPDPRAVVRFEVNFSNKTIKDSINNPNEVIPPRILAPSSQSLPSQTQKIKSVSLTFPRPLTNQELLQPMMLSNGSFEYQQIFLRDVLNDPIFQYKKSDLGYTLTKTNTSFKVWSPVSTSARVFLTHPDYHVPIVVTLTRGSSGVWYGSKPTNLVGWQYQYEFESYGKTRRAADIYAPAATQDSNHSVIVDLNSTNPPGWPKSLPKSNHKPTESIIYELHVRDFTIDPNSGVRHEWRGKYLGFTQTGTKYKNQPTGIDYLKWLGVTDVHILPFQNFNPDHSTNYNWGYETTLFNVPEEQYGTNPANPITTIRETKAMILALHNAGLRVIQDVVYNHTVPTNGERSAFDQTVPYFYFRTNDAGELLNESGVGNALADERPMVRKFVRDSLTFWLYEYQLDGYRFDLIGMFTPESVKDWSVACHQIRPDVLIYGEPWTGGGPTRFGKGAQRNTNVAVFNDDFRNALRGELDGPAPGFITTGNNGEAVKQGILGSVNTFAQKPSESINYISAHDNLTLNDKIALLNLSPELKKRAQTLATATLLLSQGIPFLEGGVELGRTKGGNHNSYNAGDQANQFDWHRASTFHDTAEITRQFIALRKSIPELQHSTPNAITFHSQPEGVVTFQINSAGNDFFVVLNGSLNAKTVSLPEKMQWQALLSTDPSLTNNQRTSKTLTVNPLTATVLSESKR